MESRISTDGDRTEMTNVLISDTGAIQRYETPANGVLIQILPGEPDEDGNPTWRHAVGMLVRDADMADRVRELARDILPKL